MEDLEKLNRNLTIYSDLIDKTNSFINNLDKSGGTYFFRDLKGFFPMFSSFPDDGVVDIDMLRSLKKKLEAKRNEIDSEIMRIKVQSIKSKRDEIPLQVSSVDTISGVKKSVVSNNNQVSRESEVKYLPEEVLDLRNIKSSYDIQKKLNSLGTDIKKYKKAIINNSVDLENIDFHGLDVDYFYCEEFRSLGGVVLSYFSNVGTLNILSSNLEELHVRNCSVKCLKIAQNVKELSLENVSNLENLELPPNLEELYVFNCNIKGLRIPQSVERLWLSNVSDIEKLELPSNLEEFVVSECSVKGLKIPQSVKELSLENLKDFENSELSSNLDDNCTIKGLKIPRNVMKLSLENVSDIENLELLSNLEELYIDSCDIKGLKMPQSVKELTLSNVSNLEDLELPLNLNILDLWDSSVKSLKIPQDVKELFLNYVNNLEDLELPLNLEELYVDNCDVNGLKIPSNLKRISLYNVKGLDLKILESISLNVEIEYRGYDDNIRRYLNDRKKNIANDSITNQLEPVSESSQIVDSELVEKIEKKKKSKSFIVKLFQGITRNQGKNRK